MQLLITGGAGFIGSNLVRAALEAGHTVRVLDNLSTGYASNLDSLECEFVEADLRDVVAVDAAMPGVDTVFHLAALGSVPRSIKDPRSTHEVNITGTLNVLEAARRHGVSNLYFSSSSSVYGANPALPKREREWVRPMSPYAVSKLAGEQYMLAYQQSFGLNTLAFRFFNVYGPGQRAGHAYAAVIPAFLDAYIRNEHLQLQGDGTQSRDFTYVGTVCRILLAAAANRATAPEPVNLAFGTNTSLLQLISKIESIGGCPAKVDRLAPRVGDVPHSQADNTSLRSIFPEVTPVSLDEGLNATFEWMKGRI